MAVIGVTGLPGAGKGCVAEILASGGGTRINVDAVGHAVLDDPEIRARLRARFGAEVVPDASPVDRTALGRLVFSDPDALRDLERIVHPPMVERVRALLAEHAAKQHAAPAPCDDLDASARPARDPCLGGEHACAVEHSAPDIVPHAGMGHIVVDAALLYRMGLDADCGRIVQVRAPFAIRLERVRKRGWDADTLRRRDSQLKEIAARAPEADAVVDNDGTLMDMETTILHLAKEWQ